jgi:hypothetical protein
MHPTQPSAKSGCKLQVTNVGRPEDPRILPDHQDAGSRCRSRTAGNGRLATPGADPTLMVTRAVGFGVVGGSNAADRAFDTGELRGRAIRSGSGRAIGLLCTTLYLSGDVEWGFNDLPFLWKAWACGGQPSPLLARSKSGPKGSSVRTETSP